MMQGEQTEDASDHKTRQQSTSFTHTEIGVHGSAEQYCSKRKRTACKVRCCEQTGGISKAHVSMSLDQRMCGDQNETFLG